MARRPAEQTLEEWLRARSALAHAIIDQLETRSGENPHDRPAGRPSDGLDGRRSQGAAGVGDGRVEGEDPA